MLRSSLSRHIRDLDEDVGVQPLTRNARGVDLTGYRAKHSRLRLGRMYGLDFRIHSMRAPHKRVNGLRGLTRAQQAGYDSYEASPDSLIRPA